jgi:hypothetical protein
MVFRPMLASPGPRTVGPMFAHALRAERTGGDPLRRPCATCLHSEFIHADGEPRGCLFSECVCGSFTVDLAATERGGRGRTTAA